MALKFILSVLLLFGNVFTQSKDPEKILLDVKKEYEKIRDYQADSYIKVDIPFLKMPDRKAVLYYKKPDKIHIESGGFAMLPKEGIKFSPLAMLESEYTAFFEREELIDDINSAVIKIIPLSSESDVLLSTVWVDRDRGRILKVESSRKPSGNFTIELKYDNETEYNLPGLISFTFSADPTLFQPQSRREPGMDTKEGRKDPTKTKTGKVLIQYSNYKVNIGLPDSLFQGAN